MIKTFDLYLYFNGYSKEYHNISRVAVKYYIDWYKESAAFFGYDVQDHESLVSN